MPTPTDTRTITPAGSIGAFSVITDGVLRRGVLAHRTGHGHLDVPTGRLDKDGVPESRTVTSVGPACYPPESYDRADTRAPRYPAVTAAWADHFGAVPCTDPACSDQ